MCTHDFDFDFLFFVRKTPSSNSGVCSHLKKKTCAADRPQRADGLAVLPTGTLPSCLWSGNIPISPRFAPSDFSSLCKFSTLTTRYLINGNG